MIWYKGFWIITLIILLVVYILRKSKHLIPQDIQNIITRYSKGSIFAYNASFLFMYAWLTNWYIVKTNREFFFFQATDFTDNYLIYKQIVKKLFICIYRVAQKSLHTFKS